MASPQLEDGFTRIANEIVEAMARLVLNSQEARCLWVIFRKTYAFHKKEDRISLSQFEEATGMARTNVCNALVALQRRHIITIESSAHSRSYSFQKDHTTWDVEGPLGRKNAGRQPIKENHIHMDNNEETYPHGYEKDEIPTHMDKNSYPYDYPQKKERKMLKKNPGDLSITIPFEKTPKVAKPKKETNPLIREVTAGINEAYGEPYPQWPKHVKAIEQLLKLEYTVAEIVGCWNDIYKQGDGRFPPLSWVVDRIRSYRQNSGKLPERTSKNGNNKGYPGPARQVDPNEYYGTELETIRNRQRTRVLPTT